MKFLKKYFFIFILVNFNSVQADNVYFVDVDYLLSESIAGKAIIKEINEDKKKKSDEYDKIGKKLRSEEKEILIQKNILNKIDYEKKIINFQIKAKDFREKRKKDVEIILKKRTNLTNLLLGKVNPIISKYAIDNSISLVIQKKFIILGKKELDLTSIIIKLLNKNVKKIKST